MAGPRLALLIGINKYQRFDPLFGAASDVRNLEPVLARHENGDANYKTIPWTYEGNAGETPPERGKIRKQLEDFFKHKGDVLFYFAGHGAVTDIGGFLRSWDSDENDLGIPMSELLQRANLSQAEEVLLILDCCFSGDLGNPTGFTKDAQLREGVTIITASRPTQTATERTGQGGVFTELLVGALLGGAADIRGYVSAAAAYGYIDQALGPGQQRPMYKSHTSQLSPVRRCTPKITDAQLRRIPELFASPDAEYQLDPSYEFSRRKTAKPENVAIFNELKILRDAGLLRTKKDLYFTAIKSGTVSLSRLGQAYWRIAKENLI